jgi:protocatechuate 3,4-dioxygenase alpha subunit
VPAATASQTIGPYWHLIEDTGWADLTRFGARATHPDRPVIVLEGIVLDGAGRPAADSCVELWQSDPPVGEHFPGFGRCNTDPDGHYRFVTLSPGPTPGPGNTLQAPHLAILVLARGLMRPLMTRAYFEGEALNASDPLLGRIEDAGRRATLMARPTSAAVWRFDVRLQGEGETIFLDV